MSLYIESVYTKDRAGELFELARRAEGIQWVEAHATKGQPTTALLTFNPTYKKFTGFDVNAIEGGQVQSASGAPISGKFAFEVLDVPGQKVITFTAGDPSITSAIFSYTKYIGQIATSGAKQPIAGPDAAYSELNEIIGHNNIAVACENSTCAGIDNILYALPPLLPENAATADITISLEIGAVLAVMKEITEGHRRGPYPLSYCNLAVPCKIYSRASTSAQYVFVADISFNSESNTAFKKAAIQAAFNSDLTYFLKAKQYIDRSKIVASLSTNYVTINHGELFLLGQENYDRFDLTSPPIICTTVYSENDAIFSYTYAQWPASLADKIIMPPDFIYNHSAYYSLCGKLKPEYSNIQPYANAVVTGQNNVCVAKNNVVTGVGNTSAYINNVINGLNNAVDGYFNSMVGFDNNVKGARSNVFGKANNISICNAGVYGNFNYISPPELLLRTLSLGDSLALNHTITEDAAHLLSLNTDISMELSGFLRFAPELTQQNNTIVRNCVEVCQVTNQTAFLSKPIDSICNLNCYENVYDFYRYNAFSAKIKIYQNGNLVNQPVWRTDDQIKVNLPDGQYTFDYQYAPFIDTKAYVKIFGDYNIISNKYIPNINDIGFTNIFGNKNISLPTCHISGNQNVCCIKGTSIYGHNNKVRINNMSSLWNEFAPITQNELINIFFPADAIWPVSNNTIVVGDSNDLTVIGQAGQANNNYAYNTVIGHNNGLTIDGFGNNFGDVNIIGSNNACRSLNDNTHVNSVNMLGANNTITLNDDHNEVNTCNIFGRDNHLDPQAENTFSGIHVMGSFNGINSYNDNAIFSNTVVIGEGNHIDILENNNITPDYYNNYFIFGAGNTFNLSPSNSNIICMSNFHTIDNCKNINILGGCVSPQTLTNCNYINVLGCSELTKTLTNCNYISIIGGGNHELTFLNCNYISLIGGSDYAQTVTNCSNVAIIGQTDYPKTDLQNTVIVPGLINCGAEVINTTKNHFADHVNTHIYLTDSDRLKYITNETPHNGPSSPIGIVFSRVNPIGRIIEFVFDLTDLVNVMFIFPNYENQPAQIVRGIAPSEKTYTTITVPNAAQVTVNNTSYNSAIFTIPSIKIGAEKITFTHVTDAIWLVHSKDQII